MGKVGIRFKLSVTLILAAAVPLAIGLISVRLLGREAYQRDKGRLFATISRHLAGSLGSDLGNQADHLRDEVKLSGLGGLIAAMPTPSEPIADIEARWTSMTESSPEIQQLLTNAVAMNLRTFQQLNPRFAELIATDSHGRLAGATNMSSDYDQSDEQWWQESVSGGANQIWMEGIHFDQSAHVYSVDISLPVFAGRDGGPPIGVVKGVLDISPLFASINHVVDGAHPIRDVVLDDGRILVRMFDQALQPLEEHTPESVMKAVRGRNPDWVVVDGPGLASTLIGFSPIQMDRSALPGDTMQGLTPIYMIVYDSLDLVMAPVNRQLRDLTLAGLALMLGFLYIGMIVADRKIVGPIQTLRQAAQTIASQARLEVAQTRNGAPASSPLAPERAAALVDQVAAIHPGDEIGDLAHDFMLMAKRVLRYHEQLETELAIKTEEIEQDLVVAREFQEALLPSTYPTVPPELGHDPIALGFFHIYKPATSVGGDFFHMVQISDHQAGVFIADVMGHGARSALITAILRTLLENLARETSNPAELITRINHQFWSLLPQNLDLVFATAFYAVFDTAASQVQFASAGHPPPLLIRHQTNATEAIMDSDLAGPALGLFEQSRYGLSSRPLEPGDVMLLYTDGVIEAPNPDGEEFGQERLQEVIVAHPGADGEALGAAVVEALHQFMDIVVSPDDICLVTVEVRARKTTADRNT